LKWAHENGCEWDEHTCASAAEAGHFETLKYAYDNGCPCDDHTHTYIAKQWPDVNVFKS